MWPLDLKSYLSGITNEVQMRISEGVVFSWKPQITFHNEAGPEENFRLIPKR